MPLSHQPMDIQMWSGQVALVTATLLSFTSTVLLPPLAEVRVRTRSLDRSRVMVIFPSWMTVT